MADKNELERLAAGMSVQVLLCRDLGHNFDPVRITRKGGAYEMQLLCTRCESTKLRPVSSWGRLQGRSRTNYVEGYLLKDTGQLRSADRAVMRHELMVRLVRSSRAAKKKVG